jgi:hypothetical protein
MAAEAEEKCDMTPEDDMMQFGRIAALMLQASPRALEYLKKADYERNQAKAGWTWGYRSRRNALRRQRYAVNRALDMAERDAERRQADWRLHEFRLWAGEGRIGLGVARGIG